MITETLNTNSSAASPFSTDHSALDFNINTMPEFYDEEAYKIAAKVKSVLTPFNNTTTSAASLELLVSWLLVPLLDALIKKVKGFMCSDDELMAMSPHRIPAVGYQPAHFFSLFPLDEVIGDAATDHYMTARQWLTNWAHLPTTIYHKTQGPDGTERLRYLVLHFESGTLANGGGFIIQYVKEHHGLRLRTVVKDGDIYYAWYDFPHEGAMEILDDLMTYGFDDFYVEHGNNNVPVPGLEDAEMIYNDI